jgi:hypothetical protein
VIFSEAHIFHYKPKFGIIKTAYLSQNIGISIDKIANWVYNEVRSIEEDLQVWCLGAKPQVRDILGGKAQKPMLCFKALAKLLDRWRVSFLPTGMSLRVARFVEGN